MVAQRAPDQGGAHADTAERILDAAEALFAEFGFEGASTRLITGRAGANLAALNYHFGSKEALFQRVFQRRLKQLDEARLMALERLEREAAGAPLQPGQILEGFFGPALRMANDLPRGGRSFMRLLGRAHTAPPDFMRTFITEQNHEVVRRYLAALCRTQPEVPRVEIAWRLHFMMGAVSYALSGIDPLALVTGCVDDTLLQPRLTAFLLGGLGAPLPDLPPWT